jgi:hypothetical protein
MTDKKSPRADVNGSGADGESVPDDVADNANTTRESAKGQAYRVTDTIRCVADATTRGELDSLEALILVMYVGVWSDYSTGAGAWPSMSTVAAACATTRQTASRKVASLVSKGWLVQTVAHPTRLTKIYRVSPQMTPVTSDDTCNLTLQGGVASDDRGVSPHATQPSPIPSPIPKEEEEKQQHAHTREGDIQDSRPAVTAPTPDDSKPVHNPFLVDDDDPRPPVVMICEEVEVYVGEQPSHVLAEKMYAELRRRVVAKLKLQGKSSSPAKVVREWVRHKLLMSSDWAEREGASANRLVRVPAMGTDLEEWMDTRAGYDATTRKSSVPTKSLNQERAEQEARLFHFDDEEVA